jgi:hypothetical protein
MIKNLARLDLFRRNPAPRIAPVPSNDNRLQPRRARPQLACRWHLNAATGRLECHWE